MVGNMRQNKTKVTNVIRYSCHRALLVVSIILSCTLSFNLQAASKGKLGSTSSASTQISITVPQTFNTISPSELLLHETNNETFCVGHYGFSQGAHVPYSLVVDDIMVSGQAQSSNKNHALSYNIYLQDKKTTKDKKQLMPGMTIDMQSTANIGKRLVDECATAGLNLSLAENHSNKTISDKDNTLGLLILLVSPN